MARNTNPNADDIDIDSIDTSTPDGMKQLRAALANVKARQEAEAEELIAARRENLFLKAGIKSKYEDARQERIAAMLRSTFAGDDIESLVSEARELGLLDAGQTAPARTDEFDETNTTMTSTTTGGAVPDAPNPIDAAYDRFHAEIKRGVPRKEAAARIWAGILAAAKDGDERVIFNEQDWLENAAPYDPHGLAGTR